MKVKYLCCSILFLMLWATLATAQVCEPDTQYAELPAGVYPQPDTVNGTDPSIGITVDACVGEPYSFLFTAIVPDEVSVDVLGTGVPLTVTLEYVKLDSTGAILIDNGSGDISTFDDISTLGINYACEPPDCIFEANTSGCVLLYSDAVTAAPGDYPLVIRTKAGLLLFNVPIEIEANFPSQPGDAIAVADGEYRLTVNEPGGCVSGTVTLSGEISLTLAPNPADQVVELGFSVPLGSEAFLEVYSVLGQKVCRKKLPAGAFTYHLNTGDFKTGLYFIEVIDGPVRYREKLTVVR